MGRGWFQGEGELKLGFKLGVLPESSRSLRTLQSPSMSLPPSAGAESPSPTRLRGTSLPGIPSWPTLFQAFRSLRVRASNRNKNKLTVRAGSEYESEAEGRGKDSRRRPRPAVGAIPDIRPEWEQRTSRLQEDLSPVLKEYNVQLRDCAQTGEWQRALEIFRAIRSVGIEPDVDTYRGLVVALTKGKQTKRALKVLVMMKDQGLNFRIRMVKDDRTPNTETERGGMDDAADVASLSSTTTQLKADATRNRARVGVKGVNISGIRSMEEEEEDKYTSLIGGERVGAYENPYASNPLVGRDEDLPQPPKLAGEDIFSPQLQEDLKPLLYEYNKQLRDLKRAVRGRGNAGSNGGKRWKQAIKLFRDMREMGIAPDIITYTTILSILGHAKQPDLLLRVFRLVLNDKNISPDAVCFSSLIDGLTRSERLGEALGAYEEMRRLGVQPNVFTYSSLMSGLVGVGDWAKAGELLVQMRDSKIVPDQIFFNSIISACARSNQLSRALEYYALMLETGLRPTAFVFSSLIIACSRAEDPVTATRIFNEMQRARVRPDLVVFNAYIAALGTSGDVEAAREVLDIMKDAKVSPDIVTYNSLLRAYDRQSDVEGCFKVLRELQAEGLQPDIFTFNTMLSACVAMGDEGAAAEILAMMKRTSRDTNSRKSSTAAATANASLPISSSPTEDEGAPDKASSEVKPDSLTYNILIRVYVNAGQQQRAVSLVRYLSRSGLAIDRSIYNTLLTGIASSSPRYLLAVQFLDEMLSTGVAPDETSFNTVIESCARVGDVIRAGEILERMAEYGISPNHVSYTSLMKAYKSSGDLDGVARIFDEMDAKGVSPDLTTYSVALSACATAGNLRMAIRFLRDIDRRGLVPNTYTYNVFLSVCAKTARWQLGLEAFKKMRKAGVEADLATFDVLIRMCNQAGQWARSVELFEQMRMSGIEPSEPVLAELIRATEMGGFTRAASRARRARQTTQTLAATQTQTQPQPLALKQGEDGPDMGMSQGAAGISKAGDGSLGSATDAGRQHGASVYREAWDQGQEGEAEMREAQPYAGRREREQQQSLESSMSDLKLRESNETEEKGNDRGDEEGSGPVVRRRGNQKSSNEWRPYPSS